MTEPVDNQATFKPRASERRIDSPVPTLTILFHPDTSRVGERARFPALVAGKVVELSRIAPQFAQPGQNDFTGLDDRHLSRKPVRLSWNRAAELVVDASATSMRVVVAGASIKGKRLFSAAALEDGAVIEIGERVVLLLHLTRTPFTAQPDLGLVGANEAIAELRHNITRVADLEVSVLIRGETGTGKELVARAIHATSKRANGPCVAVNMAAIPEATAASELFGHARGAFTGAVSEHRGYFAKASGGTLFLDEIGATPPTIQPMLLRALESHEIQPVGAAASHKVDVRIVAATDADLELSTSEESFRAALLHRLAGYQLFLPTLRTRRDDIGRLLVHFLRIELERIGEAHRLVAPARDTPPWLPAALVADLAGLDWPGNVRQLLNLVRQLVISSRGADCARVDAAVECMLTAAGRQSPAPARPQPTRLATDSDEISEDELIRVLRAHQWQVKPAATELGISRSVVYERMKASRRIRLAGDLDEAELRRCQAECGGDIAAMATRLDVSRRALTMRLKEVGLD